jgi:glutathione peroxidase
MKNNENIKGLKKRKRLTLPLIGSPRRGQEKKMRRFTIFTLAVMLFGAGLLSAGSKAGSIHDFEMADIDGQKTPLKNFKGKVILVVNVASKCGNTPQYKDLQELYGKYKGKGFVVLGFPANNFKQQEPGSNAEIKEFCSTTFGVTFPMFSKISVKGDDIHPLYKWLTSKENNPEFAGDIRWNFDKFLADAGGKIIARFTPKTKPLDEKVIEAIEKALK